MGLAGPAVVTRSAAKAVASSTPSPTSAPRGAHRLARVTPARQQPPSKPLTFDDFLRETDIQFLDHMRRGASMYLAALAHDPPPHTLQVQCLSGAAGISFAAFLVVCAWKLSEGWRLLALQALQSDSHREGLCAPTGWGTMLGEGKDNLEGLVVRASRGPSGTAFYDSLLNQLAASAGRVQADVPDSPRGCSVRRRDPDPPERDRCAQGHHQAEGARAGGPEPAHFCTGSGQQLSDVDCEDVHACVCPALGSMYEWHLVGALPRRGSGDWERWCRRQGQTTWRPSRWAPRRSRSCVASARKCPGRSGAASWRRRRASPCRQARRRTQQSWLVCRRRGPIDGVGSWLLCRARCGCCSTTRPSSRAT